MLEKLKEYKEVLTIVVFFLGGVFWIQGRYPTKADLKSQIDSLNCLLTKYMSLTQLQIRGRELERQAQSLKDDITAFGNDQDNARLQISPAMREELLAKKASLVTVQADLQTNAKEIQSTGDELGRNVCGKVGP